MNKFSKRVLMSVMMLGALMLTGAMATQVSAQAAQDFTVINKTGVEIYAMYVTPHSADEWGEDILGVDTLLANESALITFSRKERAKFWDLRIEDEEGNFIVWEKLNLFQISTLTLYYKNGKATATYTE